MDGLTYWWRKYQDIKEQLRKYMDKNKLRTVEEAIEHLLKDK